MSIDEVMEKILKDVEKEMRIAKEKNTVVKNEKESATNESLKPNLFYGMFPFSVAISRLEEGKKVARGKWHHNAFIRKDDKNNILLCLSHENDTPVTFRPTADDIFADDWMVVE